MKQEATAIIIILFFTLAIAVTTVVIKILAVGRYKRNSAAAVIKSFFRIYRRFDRIKTSNKERQVFMRKNNMLNGIFYGSIVAMLLLLAYYLKI